MYKTIISPFLDLYRQYFSSNKKEDYGFAFLIHPRDKHDIFKKFPIFKYLPNTFLEIFTRNFWPVTVSQITGLKHQETGEDIRGWVISIPLTAKQMMEDRDLALKQMVKAINLAKNKGAKIVGLGALTSSLSAGGLLLKERVEINITTGHAYTVHNVTQTLLSIIRDLNVDTKDSVLAVVGASGSIGSGCAKILSKHNFKKMILIDIERKNKNLNELIKLIKKEHPNKDIQITHQIKAIKEADFIITATNTPEALIKDDDLKMGAVVVDDAQPTDVDESVFNRDDVIILEAGAVHTPGISTNFNMGLKSKDDNYCCLAEVLILASIKYEKDYVVGRTTLDQIKEIVNLSKKMGFKISEYQNHNGKISLEKINKIRKIKQIQHDN